MSRIGVGLGTMCLALLASCHKQAAPVPTVNASMTGVMEPKGQKLWDIASAAYNDVGDALVPAKITARDWKDLEEASRAIKERATQLAEADHVVVALPNEPILGSQAVGVRGAIGKDWDAVGAEQIQARIDADPALFRKHARELADTADTIHRAALTKDTALFHRTVSGMDEVCDGCHEPFWGTDEPPPVLHGQVAAGRAR